MLSEKKANIRTKPNYIVATLIKICKIFVGMAVNIYAEIKKSAANCRSNNLPRVPHITY